MTEAILQQSTKDYLRSLRHGQFIEGEGIFTGNLILPTCEGSKLCLVYAASEDFSVHNGTKVDFTFDEAKDEVTKLKNWHGHDGRFYDYEYGVLRDICAMGEDSWRGAYKGEWFIADINFLKGGFIWDLGEVCVDSLYGLRNFDAVKNTLTLAKGVNGSTCYGSSTIEVKNNPRYVEGAGFIPTAHQAVVDFWNGSVNSSLVEDKRAADKKPDVAKYRLFRLKAISVPNQG